MEVSEAIRISAQKGCDMAWDNVAGVWRIASIAYDSDACSLDSDTLARLDTEAFIARYIPDRP